MDIMEFTEAESNLLDFCSELDNYINNGQYFNDEEEMEFDAALVAELNKRKMVAQPIPRNDKKAKVTEIKDTSNNIKQIKINLD